MEIAAGFVRQPVKNNLSLIPKFQHKKRWTGWWDLNPRHLSNNFLNDLCTIQIRSIQIADVEKE
ncbi:MAG: hypothetical protein M3247_01495 [Thermoproteota archaeon]|nr:hypothetical protein [Thermoproteota archaeon]